MLPTCPLNSLKMSHLLHRSLGCEPPVATGGEGVYVFDRDGRRYLDACGGAAVSNLGHNHPVIVAAIKQQLHCLAYAHSAFFSTDTAEALGEQLVATAPGMNRALFLSGGSEANEAALKLARQHFVERGEPQRKYFIARRQSYHGNTLGVLSVGGNEWRRQAFKPLLNPAHHIDACYAYRLKQTGESETEYALRSADQLDALIQKLRAENVIGFIAETVVGATLGAVPAVARYFERIREVCDRHGVLLILDEVMCGVGRTGTLFAYEQEHIVPDIVTLAKGLAGGYQPIGAMLCGEHVLDPIRHGSGFFQHGHTFMGHATAAAGALATLRVIQNDGLLQRVTERGKFFRDRLVACLMPNPHVGDIRGRGLFLGIELVQQRESREPFSSELHVHQKIKQQAMENGLMCYPMGGTLDGKSGDHVLLAPPFIASESELELMAQTLGRVIDNVTQGIAA